MAAKRWYLDGIGGGSWGSLKETTQSAATGSSGWVVGTGSTFSSELAWGTERLATTFIGNTVPDGTLDLTLKDAFRVNDSLTGTFASGNWTFQFAVVSPTQGGAADGQIVFRLFKADPDGSNATEITSAQQSASVVTNVASSPDANSTLTFNPGAITLVNQHLFVQIAWKRTGAGGMTTTNIRWRAGVSATVGTTILSSDFTPGDQPVTTQPIASTAVLTEPTVVGLRVGLPQTDDCNGVVSTLAPEWTVVRGSLAYTGSGKLATSGLGYNTMRWTAATFPDNQTAEAVVEVVDNAALDAGGAVGTRLSDTGNGYLFFAGWTGALGTPVLLRMTGSGGSNVVIGSYNVTPSVGTHTIRLESEGSVHRCYIDGVICPDFSGNTFKVDATYASGLAGGTIYREAAGSITALIDTITVGALALAVGGATVASTAVVSPPVVLGGPSLVTGELIASTATLFLPTVALAGGGGGLVVTDPCSGTSGTLLPGWTRGCAILYDNPRYDGAGKMISTTSAFSDARWTGDTFADDQYAQADYNGGSYGGVGVRMAAPVGTAVTGYFLFAAGDTYGNGVNLQRYTGGAGTVLQTFSALYGAHVLRIEVEGTTIRCYVDGSQIGTDQTDSALASGAAGICLYNAPTGATLDNIELGDLGAPPADQAVTTQPIASTATLALPSVSGGASGLPFYDNCTGTSGTLKPEWTNFGGTPQYNGSGKMVGLTAAYNVARFDGAGAVPGADQYIQCLTNAASDLAVGTRLSFPSGTFSGYMFWASDTFCGLYRYDVGTEVELQTFALLTAPATIRLESEGDTHRCYINGVQVGTDEVDATHTTGAVIVALYNLGTSPQVDDIELGNYATPPVSLADAATYATAHWPLEETSGNRVDTIGGLVLAEVGGTTGSAAGKFGDAADFEHGNSRHLSIATTAAVDPADNTSFMVRCWVKLESKTNHGGIVAKWSSGQWSYLLYYDTTYDRFSWLINQVSGGFTGLRADVFGAVPVDEWLLFHGWYDAAAGKLYIAINGGPADELVIAGGFASAGTGPLEIGQFDGNYFDGLIDDVVILQDRFLTEAEREADWNAGAGVAFEDWGGGGPADQAVTGSTIASTLAAFALTVAAGAVGVTGAHVASTLAVTAPTIAPGPVTITAGTRPLTSQVYVPTIAPGPVAVTAGTRPATSGVNVPSVTPGPVAIITGTRSTTIAVNVPSLAVGAVGVTTAHRTTTSSVNAPVLTAQTLGATIPSGSGAFPPSVALNITTATRGSTAQLFDPAVIASGAIGVVVLPATSGAFAPTVAPGAVPVTTATRGTTIQVYAPSLTVGPVPVTGAHRATTIQLYAPTVAPGPVTVVGASRATTLQVFQPSLAVGPASVTTATIAATSQVFLPIVAEAGVVNIGAATVPSTAQLYVLTVTTGPVSVTAGTIASTAQLFLPTVAVAGVTAVGGGTVSSTTQGFAPTVAPGPVSVTGATRASTIQVHAPSLTAIAFGATITSGSGAFPPSVAVRVTTAHRSSTAQLSAPTVVPGSPTITLPTLASTALVYGPLVTSGGAATTVLLGTIPSTGGCFPPAIARLPPGPPCVSGGMTPDVLPTGSAARRKYARS